MTAKRTASKPKPKPKAAKHRWPSRAAFIADGGLAGRSAYAAIADAHLKVASGKAGTVRNGASVKLGLIGGTIREAGGNVWANAVWRGASTDSLPAAFYDTLILGFNPLNVDKVLGTYPRGDKGAVTVSSVTLRYSGPQVAELREAYASLKRTK